MRTRSMTATITAMSIAGALSVSASQAPQTPTGTQPTPQTRTEPQTGRTGSEQTITVTGCVMQDTAAPGAAEAAVAASAAGSARETGATAAAAEASKFVLSNAKMSSDSPTAALGNMSRLSLTGMADSDIEKHLNHQVEVTGPLMAGSGMSGMSGTKPGGTETTGSMSAGAKAMTPQLHATTIKMVAATCAAK